MDSQNADPDAVPQSIDRATLLEQYEKKLEEFLKVPENALDVANQVYNRTLIQLIREINKAFQTFPCPLSEEELKKIGIDRATMPASAIVSHFKSKYQGRAGNFNPLWAGSTQANNIRNPPFTSRSSNNKKNTKNQRSPLFTNDRLCIQKQPERKLKRGENAWIPDVVKQSTHGNVGLDSVETRIDKSKKEIRGLLNKIAPSTYKKLTTEIIIAFWKDMDTLVPTVVELIFNKVMEEPKFAEMYADLCLVLHQAELYLEKEKFKRRFSKAILQKTQIAFEAYAQSAYQESVAKLEEKIKEETDEKKKADLHEHLDELKTKEKKLMLSTIRFISHLYRVGLLNYKIIENSFVVLLRDALNSTNELMVEYSIHLIENVGPFFASKDAEYAKKMDEYVVFLKQFQANVSNRVRFMILALADLSQDKWIKKDDAPKTKDEVEIYLVKKEEEWRKEHGAHKQSAAADKNRKPQKLVKQPYARRTSSGNKKDRVNYGFAVSYDAGSSNIRRDNSSVKVDTQQKLPITKSCHRSTNAPPSAAPPQAQIIKVNKPMSSRSSTGARPFSNDDVRKQSNADNDLKPIASNQKPDSLPASATRPPVDASSNVSSADQNKAFKEVFTKAANLCLNEVNDEEVSP